MEMNHQSLVAAAESGDQTFAMQPASHAKYILVVDCETRRFSIEGPLECVGAWHEEVKHAKNSGRHVFCIPVPAIDLGEIEELGAQLGYDQWPSKSIVAPQSESPNASSVVEPSRYVRKREDDSRSPLEHSRDLFLKPSKPRYAPNTLTQRAVQDLALRPNISASANP